MVAKSTFKGTGNQYFLVAVTTAISSFLTPA